MFSSHNQIAIKLLNQYDSKMVIKTLPPSPILCPHFRFLVRIWSELVTVEPITSVNLQKYKPVGIREGIDTLIHRRKKKKQE